MMRCCFHCRGQRCVWRIKFRVTGTRRIGHESGRNAKHRQPQTPKTKSTKLGALLRKLWISNVPCEQPRSLLKLCRLLSHLIRLTCSLTTCTVKIPAYAYSPIPVLVTQVQSLSDRGQNARGSDGLIQLCESRLLMVLCAQVAGAGRKLKTRLAPRPRILGPRRANL